jgi:hypothetical protein
MLGREAKDMIEGDRAVSYWVELVGVAVVVGSPSDSAGIRSEDELGRGVPLPDLV